MNSWYHTGGTNQGNKVLIYIRGTYIQLNTVYKLVYMHVYMSMCVYICSYVYPKQ